MRTNHEFTQQCRHTGKPDIGSRPSIDDQIHALKDRIRHMNNEVGALSRLCQNSKTISIDRFAEFQKLNEALKNAKIEEANITYLRNML